MPRIIGFSLILISTHLLCARPYQFYAIYTCLVILFKFTRQCICTSRPWNCWTAAEKMPELFCWICGLILQQVDNQTMKKHLY